MDLRKLCVLLSFVVCVTAYRHGAPKSACDHLTPHHGHHRSQTKPIPFTLSASLDLSKPGKTFLVTLKGLNDDDYFQGFLVQARDEESNSIGRFTVLDEFSDISQLLRCNHSGDSITHKEIDGDVNTVSFHWTAPKTLSSAFAFHFTVAKSKDVFWADVSSYYSVLAPVVNLVNF